MPAFTDLVRTTCRGLTFEPRRARLRCACMTVGFLLVPGAWAGAVNTMGGTWDSLTLSGSFAHLSPSLRKFRWLVIDQNRIRDDGSGAWRLSENVLYSQLGYDINENASVWLGYIHDWIHPLNEPAFQESGPYQDLLFTFPAFDLTLDIRTRFEERINETTGDVGVRVWQLLLVHLPLVSIDPKLSLYFGDDILGYLNSSSFGADGFNENRAIMGVNYEFTPAFDVDFGYLGQYLLNKNANAIFTHNIFANVRYRF